MTPEQRKFFVEETRGKIIREATYVEDAATGNYWAITFEDDSEISVVLMSDLVRGDR